MELNGYLLWEFVCVCVSVCILLIRSTNYWKMSVILWCCDGWTVKCARHCCSPFTKVHTAGCCVAHQHLPYIRTIVRLSSRSCQLEMFENDLVFNYGPAVLYTYIYTLLALKYSSWNDVALLTKLLALDECMRDMLIDVLTLAAQYSDKFG